MLSTDLRGLTRRTGCQDTPLPSRRLRRAAVHSVTATGGSTVPRARTSGRGDVLTAHRKSGGARLRTHRRKRARRLIKAGVKGYSESRMYARPESGQQGSSSGKNAGMTTEQLTEDDRALIAASRPTPDMNVAREAGEVITHMLGDGRSVIDPSWTIWTAEAAERASRQDRG